MWVSSSPVSLPRTKKIFYITSNSGILFFVKPGKGFIHRNNSWISVHTMGLLNNKIEKVIISPNGTSSIHLPKLSPLLALHINEFSTNVVTIPIPKDAISIENDFNIQHAQIPNGKDIILTTAHSRVKDFPYVMAAQKNVTTTFNQRVRGLATSERRTIIAIAVDEMLWVWHQISGLPEGMGEWLDLTTDSRFGIPVLSNHPQSQLGKVSHGVFRQKQTFTLHPALAPNIPQNSAVSYQDLCVFDNPDEGKGVCCLTAVLPPCIPFDTLYLFVSICHIRDGLTYFAKADVTLPIYQGGGSPCVWWSHCCRIIVVAVSKSIVLLTRNLRIISILSLSDVFGSDEVLVADASWSASGLFFILTSTTGEISAITRTGKSMKHVFCSTTKFSTNLQIPLMVKSDTRDPSLFVVYSRDKMRSIRIDISIIPSSIENLFSIHYPYGVTSGFFDLARDLIRSFPKDNPKELVRLLYFTDIFSIFPYHSPLRYNLITLFDDCIKNFHANHNELIVFFLLRCVLYLTGEITSLYNDYMNRLAGSSNPRDVLLSKIMEDEVLKIDYVDGSQGFDDRINLYSIKDKDNDYNIQKPPPLFSVDIDLVSQIVCSFMYDPSPKLSGNVSVDLRILLDILISYGRIEQSIILARHQSIGLDSFNLFKRVVSQHGNNPRILYRALTACLENSPDDEDDLRSSCLTAFNLIIQKKILNTMPNNDTSKNRQLSRIAVIEESLDLIIPSQDEQIDDFAIVLSIAFCIANYSNVSLFLNGKMKLIPEKIRKPLRDLFMLIWFIRWREAAINETNRIGRANDATLRLLIFPEFINRYSAMKQIKEAGMKSFSPDIYSLYTSSSASFEDDPAFIHYITECSRVIRNTSLNKVHEAVMKLTTPQTEKIPRSQIFISTVISHMVPWLRCGIPRKILNVETGFPIPPYLIEFEEFYLPSQVIQKMEIITRPIVTSKPNTEITEEEELKEKSDIIDSLNIIESSGEVEIHQDLPLVSSSVILSESEKSSKKKVRVKRVKKQKKKIESDEEVVISIPKSKQPSIRLLSLDPNYTATRQEYIPPRNEPIYQPKPQFPPNGPIWDVDPSRFERPLISKPAPQTPIQESSQKIVFVGTKKLSVVKEKLPISESSSLSSFTADEPQKLNAKGGDPFPIDEELHKKVEKLLDGADVVPKPKELPVVMKYQHRDIHTSYIPPSNPPTQIQIPPTPKRTENLESDSSSFVENHPDWKPSVRSIKGNKLISIHEMSSKANDVGTRVMSLKEIPKKTK